MQVSSHHSFFFSFFLAFLTFWRTVFLWTSLLPVLDPTDTKPGKWHCTSYKYYRARKGIDRYIMANRVNQNWLIFWHLIRHETGMCKYKWIRQDDNIKPFACPKGKKIPSAMQGSRQYCVSESFYTMLGVVHDWLF